MQRLHACNYACMYACMCVCMCYQELMDNHLVLVDKTDPRLLVGEKRESPVSTVCACD